MSLATEYRELEKLHGVCQRCCRSAFEQWHAKTAEFANTLQLLDGVEVIDINGATPGDVDIRQKFDALLSSHRDAMEIIINGGIAELPSTISLTGSPLGDGNYTLTHEVDKSGSGSYYQMTNEGPWYSGWIVTLKLYTIRRIYGRWQLCTSGPDWSPLGIGKLGNYQAVPIGSWSHGGTCK